MIFKLWLTYRVPTSFDWREDCLLKIINIMGISVETGLRKHFLDCLAQRHLQLVLQQFILLLQLGILQLIIAQQCLKISDSIIIP